MAGYRCMRDIPGIVVGHATNEEAGTGCTVIIAPQGATGAVDVRGGAPATRETDLLRPEQTVDVVHAVVLSGGSTFGLAASTGVAEELEKRGIGLELGSLRIPIVVGASLFDLFVGSSEIRPGAEDGAFAVQAAFEEKDAKLERGNVGVGTGCSVGKIAGTERMMKSGVGECVRFSSELVVGALSAVNAVGDVFDPKTGAPLAGVLSPQGDLLANTEEQMMAMAAMPLDGMRTNTTISCLVTNAKLTKAQATKVAQISADAYAHAIRPSHTTNDGDTIFVLATGNVEAPLDAIATLATSALEGAIVDAVLQARSAYGLCAACDIGSLT